MLWRLSNGELVPPMSEDRRLLTVLLIGTNNLGSGHGPQEVADGITHVARRLLNQSRGKVLVNALLPRGDGARALTRICPPRCARDGHPLRSFRHAIERVNTLVSHSISQLSMNYPDRVRFVDCGQAFQSVDESEGASEATDIGLAEATIQNGNARADERRTAARASARSNTLVGKALDWSRTGGVLSNTGLTTASDEVRVDLMPDKLHPNALGHRIWANCLSDDITAARWDVLHPSRRQRRR